jgi:branched-chain amino acid transport system substrate-binding protein
MKIINPIISALFLCLAAAQFSPAKAEDVIRIGAIFSASGWGADGGTSELDGALLAQADINARGGIGGQRLELLVEDNQSDLKDTASAFKKLVSVQKVPAMIGPNWAEFVEIAAPLAQQHQIPMLSPSGYKDGLFTGKDFIFTLWPPHATATKPLSDYLIAQKYKAITVLLSENAYLEGVMEAVQAQLQGSPAKIRTIMRFIPGQKDFKSTLAKIKQSGSDAVLALLLENGDLSNFFKQTREIMLNLPLYSANGPAFDEIIHKDPAIAEGVIYFDYLVPGGAEFLKRFQEKFQRLPGFASAKAYDAVCLIKQAIETCGAAPSQIKDCLKKIHYQGLSGEIEFDANGVIRSSKPNTYLIRIRDGKLEKL